MVARDTGSWIGDAARGAVLLVALLVVLFPFFWIFIASIKPPDLVARPEVWIFSPSAANWREVLLETRVPRAASPIHDPLLRSAIKPSADRAA